MQGKVDREGMVWQTWGLSKFLTDLWLECRHSFHSLRAFGSITVKAITPTLVTMKCHYGVQIFVCNVIKIFYQHVLVRLLSLAFLSIVESCSSCHTLPPWSFCQFVLGDWNYSLVVPVWVNLNCGYMCKLLDPTAVCSCTSWLSSWPLPPQVCRSSWMWEDPVLPDAQRGGYLTLLTWWTGTGSGLHWHWSSLYCWKVLILGEKEQACSESNFGNLGVNTIFGRLSTKLAMFGNYYTQNKLMQMSTNSQKLATEHSSSHREESSWPYWYLKK